MRALILSLGALFFLAIGFTAGWYYWGWRWRLAPVEEPPAGTCELHVEDIEALWKSLMGPSESQREQVRLIRDRDRARLEIIEDGASDDSIASTKDVYFLSLDSNRRWQIRSCSSVVLQCQRGFFPVESACP